MKVSDVEAIVQALNAAAVPFIVVGGLAVVAHGYGRQTHDLDLVIQLNSHMVRSAFSALKSLDYLPRVPVTVDQMADDAARQELISQKGMAVLPFYSERHRDTPLDLFTTVPFDFETEYRDALRLEIAPGILVHVVSLSTLIALKSAAARPQDLADIAELKAISGNLK